MKIKEILPALFSEWKIRLTKINTQSIKHKQQSDLIVSFTSIPSRLNKLDIVVKSLLMQTRLPKKITIWLHNDLKNTLPKQLVALTKIKFNDIPILELHYSNLTCSHRKLIHCIDEFPNQTILTCDDDSIYPDNWLALLDDEHIKYPNDIICNRCNYISYDHEGKTLPYKQWDKNVKPGSRSLSIMPAGYAGIIYPANCLHKDVTNSKLFLELAPKADDLWFKAMSFFNNTYCRKTKVSSKTPITILGTQKITLAKNNIQLDQNKTQWDSIRQHYNSFKTPDHLNPDS